jgi:hypothetical protein
MLALENTQGDQKTAGRYGLEWNAARAQVFSGWGVRSNV